MCIGRAKKGTTPRERAPGPPRRGRGRPAARSRGDVRRGPSRAASAAASRRPTRGRRRVHTGDDPGTGGADTGGSPATATPARTQTPAHVRAWGQRRLTCTDLGRSRASTAYAARLWLPMLRADGGRRDGPLRSAGSAARRRGRPPCWRPARAPARRSRWPVWSRATSPRARRRSTRCCSSRSAARPARSCASGSAARSSTRSAAFDDPSLAGDNQVVAHLLDGTRRRASRRGAATARRAGRLRRRDHRHHAPVLPAGAEVARRGRRHRRRCHAGREPRRPGHRDRRRPLPRATSASERDDPLLTYEDALRLAREVVEQPGDGAAAAATRRRTRAPRCASSFAKDVLAELEIRKRRLGILGYDDLLTRLADALEADDSPAQVRMHQRWPIVMVDEFQDTDPVQWQVIDRAFSGRSTLILIGDPKQAIYAFRGGDIVTYLQAAETAGEQADARHQLAQRRARWSTACRRCCGGAAARRPATSSCTRSRRTTRAPAGGRAAQRPVPAAGGARGRRSAAAELRTIADRRPAHAHPPGPRRRHRRAAGQRRHLRRRAAARPATSR